MHNHRLSKRKQLAIRFFGYGFMTLATVVVSLVCILLVLGYRFDFQRGTVEQGGLVQFRSFPPDANIWLDGKKLSFQTPGKQNVNSGEHAVSFARAGYHDWQKNFVIKPGELRWLNYARLIPTTLTTSSDQSFESVVDSLASPDRRWYVVAESRTVPEFEVFDISEPETIQSTLITLPADTYTTEDVDKHSFEFVEWDISSQFLLIKHTYDGKMEFIRVNRSDNDATLNVSRSFNLSIKDMQFVGSGGSQLYAKIETDLRLVDLGNETVSRPLVRNVQDFELYKNDIVSFTAERDGTIVAGVYKNGEENIVRSYESDTVSRVLVDVSSYFDREYMAVAANDEVEIIRDPFDTGDVAGRAYAALERDSGIDWLQFSNNGRFVSTGSGTSFSTYDLETDELFASDFPRSTAATTPLNWLDDYYFATSAGGVMRIGEFDGSNQHDITSVTAGSSMTLSDNGEWLFSIGETESGSFQLQRTNMVVLPN